MKNPLLNLLIFSVAIMLGGCGVYHRQGLEPARLRQVESAFTWRQAPFAPELAERILALDPTNVTAQDVRSVLSQAPAPRIVNIHGGLATVIARMVSFSEFLVGMGYPVVSLTNPSDGTYSFSCYESSEKIAGAIAWYYEHEGLRPMIVGHSQGGMQAVKVLWKLAGLSARKLHVWNPLSWEREERCEILDPVTGQRRPVVGLKLPYATSMGAGGLTRVLPNQWDMCGRLRDIPDSVEEFTGFFKGKDLYGGDWLGYGPANHFKSMSKAVVRNVRLPAYYKHGGVPDNVHLLKSQQLMDWLNNYHPNDKPYDEPRLDVKFDADSKNILWAADVWYSIKKHWVLELQRLLRARHGHDHGN